MKVNEAKAVGIVGLVVLSIWIAAIVGWVLNIVDIFHTMANPVNGLFILRCIGIVFAPLGSVLGLFA